MFSLASGIYQSYFVPQQLSILLIGEENTGKTTLLERIKVTQTSRSVRMAVPSIACPAPKKYSAANMIQEETTTIETSSNNIMAVMNSQEESSRSLEEIPLNDGTDRRDVVPEEETFQEYNVKPGARMLPLDKIRPTSTSLLSLLSLLRVINAVTIVFYILATSLLFHSYSSLLTLFYYF